MIKTETCSFYSQDGEVLVRLASFKGHLLDPKMKLLNSSRNYIYLKLEMSGQTCKNKTIIKPSLNEAGSIVFNQINFNSGTFEKKEKKYQLIKMVKKKSLKEILKPFDLKSADLPHFNIPKRIAKVMQIIADVKIYSEGLRNLNIDTEYLPLSSLNKELLIEVLLNQ